MILDLFELETIGDAVDSGGGAAGEVAAETAVDPGAAADTAAAVETPAAAEPAIDPRELQAELDYLRQRDTEWATRFQQISTPPAGDATPGLPELDPFDPDSVRAYNDAREEKLLAAIDQRLQTISQPLAQAQQQQQAAENEQLVQDMIADDVARNGEFVTGTEPEQQAADRQARQLVDTLAASLYPETAARYGAGSRAAELALGKAADQVRQLLKAAGQTAVNQHDNRLATLSGVKPEPGTSVAGVAGQQEFTNPRQIVDFYATRARSLTAQ